MKRTLLLCCILITTSIFVTSCKDEVNDLLPVTGQYFNTGEGSQWIFSNYRLYYENDVEQSSELSECDTLTQLALQYVLGKNAIIMRHHFVNPVTNNATTASYAIYEDVEQNQLYVNSDFLKIFLPEVVQMFWDIAFDNTKWYMLADGNAKKEWILDSFELSNYELSIGGFDIILDGYLKFGVKRNEDTTIASYQVNTYTISVFFEGKAKSTNYVIGPLLATADRIRLELMNTNFYLSNGKGLIGIYSPVQNMTVTLYTLLNDITMPLPIPPFDGFDKRLKNINIK